LFEYQSATAGEAEDTSFAAAPRCSRQASDEHETLRQGTLFLVAVSLVIAVGMLLTERVATDAASLSAAAQGTAALLLSSVILRPRAKLERLADFFGVQGLVALSGFAGGVISLMGLRMHFDLQDEALLAIDRAIGFDAESYIGSVIRAPDLLFQLSGGAYTSTLGILLVSLFIASLIGEQLEVWRAAFCFAGSLMTVCIVSILAPARGVARWLSPELMARLPNGAGRYFWPSFDRFYGGGPVVLCLRSIDAVVSFPSFHIIMGLIIVTLWRKRWATLLPAAAFFVCMAAVTVPLGGHYAVDLIGGLVVWGLWLAISIAVARSGPMRFAPSSLEPRR
jgi:membrane-associated phospholipid phosphatase